MGEWGVDYVYPSDSLGHDLFSNFKGLTFRISRSKKCQRFFEPVFILLLGHLWCFS